VGLRVAISGGFDPIHAGHIGYIEDALKLGDSLIVILTRDDQLVIKKGFVLMPYDVRKKVLEWGLKGRGEVVENIDEGIESIESLRGYRPGIFAKGGSTWNLENLPEKEVCEELGVKVIFGVGGFEKVQSSSDLVGKIKRDVTIVIPTHDEEESIGSVIDEIRALPIGCKILVVDGLSTDRTRDIVEDKKVPTVLEHRQGKGRAVRTALNLVDSKYVVLIDGDLTYSPSFIPLILDSLGTYDMVMGPRVIKEEGSMSFINEVGNHLLTMLTRLLFGIRIKDLCTGLLGFKREVVMGMKLESEGFTLEADFLTNAVKMGCKIGEVPITYRKRKGKAKLKVWDGFKIAWFLVKRRLGG